MNGFYVLAGISAAVSAGLILKSCRDRRCSWCFKSWAVFTRRMAPVCRACKREIDHKGLLAHP